MARAAQSGAARLRIYRRVHDRRGIITRRGAAACASSSSSTTAAAAATTTTTTTTHAAGCSAKVVKAVGFVDAKAMLKKIKEMEEDDGE